MVAEAAVAVAEKAREAALGMAVAMREAGAKDTVLKERVAFLGLVKGVEAPEGTSVAVAMARPAAQSHRFCFYRACVGR